MSRSVGRLAMGGGDEVEEVDGAMNWSGFRKPWIGPTTVGMLAVPQSANACSQCADSMIYASLPWVPFVFAALALWLLTDLAICRLAEGPSIPDGTISPAMWAVILVPVPAFCMAGMFGLGFFMMLSGSYILYRLVQEIIALRCELPRLSRVLSISTLIVVLLIVLIGSWKRATMTEFEVYDRYIFSGTGPARMRAESIAADRHFDIELLRPMLESGSMRRREKAFEVLRQRQNAEDLVRFAEPMLSILPEIAPPMNRRYHMWSIWMWLWLENIDLEHIETRADLEEWLESIDQRPSDESRSTTHDQRSY